MTQLNEPPEEETSSSASSNCLLLSSDDAEGSTDMIKQVLFQRDERGEGSLDDAAADLLGIHGERVRCFSLPGFEKKLGLSLHMYIDLQAREHGMAHNTNATQLFLIAHLPEEPPSVYPASIHGPVLLSAEAFPSEEYVDLGLGDWTKVKAICRAIQPNAQFVPYEAPSGDEPEVLQEDD